MKDEEELKHWAMVFSGREGAVLVIGAPWRFDIGYSRVYKVWVGDASSQKLPSEGSMA